MAGLSLTVTDLMDLSIIWRGISSALMEAKVPVFFRQLTNDLFLQSVPSSSVAPDLPLLCSSLSFSCFFSPLCFTLAFNTLPLFGAVKWVWWLAPIPRELSYLDTFTICSPSVAESLAEAQQQRNATSYCSLILIYLSRSYRHCVYVWHSWWLHCVHCVVSTENGWDGRIVPLTSGGKEKLSGGSKSLWLNPAPSDCSLCVGLDCGLSVICRMLTDC